MMPNDPRVERLLAIVTEDDELRTASRENREAKAEAILELRRPTDSVDGLTWAEIGRLLGVSAQRAEQLSRA